MFSISALLTQPVLPFKSLVGEHYKATSTVHLDETWFADFLDARLIAQLRSEGIYPIKSTFPRMLSIIDQKRRYAVLLDARYCHYQVLYLRQFGRRILEIASHVNRVIKQEQRVPLPTEFYFDSIEYLCRLGMLFCAERLCNPLQANAGEVAWHVSMIVANHSGSFTSSMPRDENDCALSVAADLVAIQTQAKLEPLESILLRYLLLHECGHLKFNGFAGTAASARAALARALQVLEQQQFAEGSHDLIFALKAAMADPRCLEEIAADEFAINAILESIKPESIDLRFFRDLMLVQLSALVSAVFFSHGDLEREQFISGAEIQNEGRLAFEPSARTEAALALLITVAAEFLPKQRAEVGHSQAEVMDDLLEYKTHIVNGSRLIELGIRQASFLRFFQFVRDSIIPGWRYGEAVAAAKEQPLRVQHSYFSVSTLVGLGWTPEELGFTVGSTAPQSS